MSEVYKPEPYQVYATAHVEAKPYAGLFLEMGLGKTVATLTALVNMLRNGIVKRVLVIAPLNVAQDTWSDEVEKWSHTKHLRVSKVLGNEKSRNLALAAKADIYTINLENVAWLVSKMQGSWPFDTVVIDELSKFKSHSSRRFKALRMVRPKMKRVIGLTGTPRPNSLLDLWSQLFLLDMGERLGPTIGQYKDKYFKPDKQNGHIIYSYKLKKETEPLIGEEIYAEEIYDKIRDICVSMRAKDYITLPDKIFRVKELSMSADAFAKYREFEKDLCMEINDKDITVANAAVLTGKLLQFSGGAMYDDERVWHSIHDTKLDALEDIVEEAQGAPVLIFYNYIHEYERIVKRLKGYKPRLLKTPEDRRAWNRGEICVGIGHAKSIGHGLNLQAGGNIIVWYGPQWSLELNDQAIARLHRRGQKEAVIIHYLVCKGTMDLDVIDSLTNKRNGQNGAMRALKAKVQYYNKAA